MTRTFEGKLGVGIVGLSATRGWGAVAHVPALAMLPDAYEIRGLVGSSPESATAAGEKFGTPFATDKVEELVVRPDIDLVVVTLVVPKHKRVVEAALEAGKAVLCEWPLARDMQEAEYLTQLAQRKKLRCFVGLQARMSPAVRFVRDLIAQGYVGNVLSINVKASVGQPWGIRVVDARQTMYQADGNGATVLTIPFGHAWDAICDIWGELINPRAVLAIRRPFTTVHPSGKTMPVTSPDQLALSGTFSCGILASVHFRAGIQTGNGFQWEINGTDGDLLLTTPSGHLQFGDITVRGANAGSKEMAVLPIPDSYWPLEGDRTSVAYNVALVYDAIQRDLRSGTHEATTFADALARHKSLQHITTAAGQVRCGQLVQSAVEQQESIQ